MLQVITNFGIKSVFRELLSSENVCSAFHKFCRKTVGKQMAIGAFTSNS